MAIDDLLNEHEQGERVQTWLRRNGAGLIGGVVLGLGLIGGWQWWQGQQDAKRKQAADEYQAVVKALAAKDSKQAQAKAATLAGTAYAPLAALDLARAQVVAGQRDAAIATLRGAKAKDPSLQQVIDQRLARLLIDANKGADAVALLASADDAAGIEARGDAQLALGKRADARRAYTEALARLDADAPRRPLLELKLTDAGGTPATPEGRTQ